ncbi:aldehyde dehydrogenase [Amphibacillus xylanus]|uniref:Aldehyde dehydrogenase n=1 Tax=Amphibacillus xylanus (strain ATCC 51415 / DSM 6626 / JCM 7361 / LMG 17667 / NBRC 15112 / Ep01) TaxID=698758 RepID=K0IZM4_AMPXN|nr:aldehyde dehydrogenase [Amphibacillus xylanus]BAM46417.1 aldehyde dehydrogenase [Amphibacillus xylanus NBRC 15112]
MDLLERQKDFFYSGVTRPYQYRKRALTLLKGTIKNNESKIMKALQRDLNKSDFEAFTTEIGLVYTEIDFVLKHLKKWMKPKRVKTPMTHVGSVSRIYPDPFGVALIISPWNYPFQLAMTPLVGAIAGGNTAVIKPSELTPTVSKLIKEIIDQTFIEDYIAVELGGVETSQKLLDQAFDYIFFTGSVPVGKIVMEKASQNLTPITLELGGKSPVIVHDDASLKLAAKRIAWGKFTNAGQTCVAPDYLFVQENVKEQFLTYLKEAIIHLYGERPLDNPDYGKIVSDKHFQRLVGYLNNGEVCYGGTVDEEKHKIEPTILTDVDRHQAIMHEEIFGPILPVLTYSHLDEAIDYIRRQPKPLSFYLFSETAHIQNTVLEQISFGGGCINDTLYHLGSPHLPFGGIGESGIGSYRGKFSFETFTHQKSVLKQSSRLDLPFRYPNKKNRMKWARRVMK